MALFPSGFLVPKKGFITRRVGPETGKINILFYNDFFKSPRVLGEKDRHPDCHFFTDTRYMADADAVIFHLPGFSKWKGLKKPPGQLWIAETHESDLNYPHQSDPDLMGRFDVVASYHQDSDLRLTYLPPIVPGDLLQPVPPKTESEPASCLISNGGGRQHAVAYRSQFLLKLSRYLPVAFYGTLHRNRTLKNDTGRDTKLRVIARHKFNLAFENAHDRDYVTEKFYEGFVAGTVPVYAGAPNAQDYAPGEKSFIHVRDYGSPEALAEYLNYLDRNEEAYQEYFAWKDQPLSPSLLKLFRLESRSGYCRMAERVVALKRGTAVKADADARTSTGTAGSGR